MTKELYDISVQLATEGPSTDGLRRMHEITVVCLAEATRDKGGSFGNLFSQLDYVCKHLGMSNADRIAMQTMRLHSNQLQPPDPDDWLFDLRALALLISATSKTDVPGELLALLPKHAKPQASSPLRRKRLSERAIVNHWDDHTIYADTDEGETTVEYVSEKRDDSYLRRILREGMQIAILEDSTVIVEPDFMVDISSVAACFTAYGHHPLIYTLNRLQPRATSQPALLGDFAGDALDNIINQAPQPWRHTLQRSFRQQALRYAACNGFDADRFRIDAQEQIKNIEEAVGELFEREGFDRKKALLEPSFVCAHLGLQGRVDLMTEDMHLLVEQKSGRNMKIERQSHDSHGLQQESHYVQLLLYYAILRYNFGRTDQQVDTRLLYSRYEAHRGLLSVNFFRTLLHEAICLRNKIVATDIFIAREGFGRIMPQLRADVVYRDVRQDEYFVRYVLPKINGLSLLYSSLRPLERAYYEQMMTFVYREQLCQKLGSATASLQHSGGAACDLWLMTLREKRDTGNIYTDLKLTKREKSDPHGGYDIITFSVPPQGELFMPNFRRGDMVYVYSYAHAEGRDLDREPRVTENILYKGTLEEMGAEDLVVRLNDGQQNPNATATDGKMLWAMEHGGSDVGTSSCIRSLQQFISAPPHRRDLLLGQREPEADATRRLSKSYHANYDELLRREVQARDYFLLVGPPGTGKTSMALRFMVAEELSTTSGNILLMSYTNRAVDEICEMLEGQQWPYLRLGNEASCDPRFRSHLPEGMLSEQATLDTVRQQIDAIRIVVGTTSTLQSRQDIFAMKQFGLCIVDEASQILEPNIIGLLSMESIGRFVLVGDYKQLPAVVMQGKSDAATDNELLKGIGLTDCRQSLFERLIRWEQHCGRQQFIGTLDHQGRMHPEVAEFPCEHFYADEGLQPVMLPHQQEIRLDYPDTTGDKLDMILKTMRVAFFDTGEHDEAAFVATLLGRIRGYYGERFDADKTVGVIVPYRNQIAQIRKEVERQHLPSDLLRICIDTVERYQGSQRDVIVYSFAVSHRYQLDFLAANTFTEDGRIIDRKLNVAMTRARRQLLITGRKDVISANPLFREVAEKYEVETETDFFR